MTFYKDSKRFVGTNANRIGVPVISGGWKEVGRSTIQTAPTNTLTSTQGNNGGSGQHSSGAWAGSGGGGGSSSVGSNSSTSAGGNGGNGTANTISGSSITYATGGAGAGNVSDGTGGSSNANNNNVGQSATANRGSGGGGAKNGTQGGAGSSGIVVIRFTTSGNTYSQSGGTVTTSGSDTIISYTTTSGTKTFTPSSAFNVQYLVVGGGGSAGAGNEPTGAGGAGGYLAGTGHGVTAQSYSITIGAGGSQPSTSAGDLGNDGGNSSFDDFIAIGGGSGGGRSNTESIRKGRDGASGGGSGTDVAGSSGATTGGSATKSYLPTPAVDEDFTSYANQSSADAVWVPRNTSVGRVNISNDVLDATGNVSTIAGVVRDIGAVGSTFVLRFKIVITTASQYSSGAIAGKLNIGLFSTNQNASVTSAEELIALDVNTFDNNYRFKAGGSVTADAGGSTGAGGYTTETRYVEIKRLTGGDCKLSIFTSDAYTTSVLEGSKTLTPTGTITSALRYLGVKSGNSGSGDGTVVLTIDDISFWNNTTYVATGDTLTVSNFADKKYYMVLYNAIPSGEMTEYLTFGSLGVKDTTESYANRVSKNGASSGSGYDNRQNIVFSAKSGGTQPEFAVSYIANKSDRAKLLIGHSVNAHTAGANQEPDRTEFVGKQAQTSNPLNVVSFDNTGTGDYVSGTECVVLGYDPDDTHTDNFWEQLASVDLSGGDATSLSSGTFTAKKYLWVQVFAERNSDANIQPIFRVGNSSVDTLSNYSFRYSSNGATDATVTTDTSMGLGWNAGRKHFINMFIINNSSNEKLIISHDVNNNASGAGNAPNRFESVGKWANTSSQINVIQMLEEDGFTFGTDSFIKVWGHD